jgi:hypothetical protein
MIKIYNHNEIDKTKWDECVLKSSNGLIYSMSWYLDAVSPGWNALIDDDYQYVFPLTHKKKFGISYLMNPNHIQNLAIIGNNVSAEKEIVFLELIKKEYKYSNLRIASSNYDKLNSFFSQQYINYELNLNETYSTLYSNYSRKNKKNVKSGRNKGLTLKEYHNIEEFIAITREILSKKLKGLRPIFWVDMQNLLNVVVPKGHCKLYATYDNQGRLCSVTGFLHFKNRWYLMYNSANEYGRKLQSHYFVLDNFISQHACDDLILDFVGSNVSSIANFFEGFGATKTLYYGLLINKLPLFLRLIKK